jgi:hypothetical protein
MAAFQTETSSQQRRSSRYALGLIREGHGSQQHTAGPISLMSRDIHTVVNAIAQRHIEMPRWSEERFIAWGAVAIAMTSGLLL